MKRLTYALATLAGARPDALKRARAATGQAATTGVVMLITAAIACCTMGYALHRAFAGDGYSMHIAVAGGLLWGAFILAVDRLLLLGIDKKAPWYKVGLQLVLRVPIAVVLGVAISKPVILRISQTVLDRNLREEKRNAVGVERDKQIETSGLATKTRSEAELRAELRRIEARLKGEPDTFDYVAARREVTSAEQNHRAVANANTSRIARARRQLEALERSDRAEDERRARSLRGSIAAWRGEIERAARAIHSARAHVEDVRQQWLADERAKLSRTRNELDAAAAAAQKAAAEVNAEGIRSDAELTVLMRPNLVNEYATLKRIQATPSHPDAKTLTQFELALDLLFILFELTPLLSKTFSRTSGLDHATSAVEEEERERIDLEKLAVIARLQKVVEVSHSIEDEALEQWADAKLEEMRQNLPLTTQKLQSIRAEIDRLSA